MAAESDLEIAVLSALRARTTDAELQVTQGVHRGAIMSGKRADFTHIIGKPLGEPDKTGALSVRRTNRRRESGYRV